MVVAEIVNIRQEETEDGEKTYFVEFTLPQYSDTFETEPIPVEEYDQGAVSEQVRETAAGLVSDDEYIGVEFPDAPTEQETEGTDRRQVLILGAGFLSVAALAGSAWGVMNDDPEPNSITPVPTDTPTDPPTDTPTDPPTDPPTDSPTDPPTDSPTDPPTDSPTDTETPAELPSSISFTFEDNNINEWQYLNINDRPGRGSFSVTQTAIAGDYSLLIESDGNELQNMIATTEKILDGNGGFTLSFKFWTPEPDNRGPMLRLITQNGTDFIGEDHPFPEKDDGIGIRLKGQIQDEKPLIFSGEKFERPNIMTDTIHEFKVEKRDSTATLYFDGEEVAQSNVDLKTEYKIGVATSGAWGSPSIMKYDDIRVDN